MTGSDIVKQAKKYLGKKGLIFCKEYGYNDYVDWCVIFIWYVFRKAKASSYLYDGKKIQNVGVLDAWCLDNCKKVSIKNCKAGDIIIESWDGCLKAHAGIVTRSINSSSCETIEGNAGSLPNTETKVKICTRYKQNIYAIYRPNYNKEEITKDLTSMVKDVLSNKYGTVAKTKKALGSNYTRVKKEVDRIAKLTSNTLRGDYGNGSDRKKSLGNDYDLVQWNINRILLTK